MKKSADITYRTQSNMNGEKITIEWHDLLGRRLPNKKWHQVHIIANYGGKVVFSYFEKLGLYNLPGGHVEQGETVDMALRRELSEETGGVVIDWEPIGYQKRTDSNGSAVYQLRVYADVSGIQEASVDYDGTLVPTKLVDFDDMLKVWGWENPIGRHVAELVEGKFSASGTSSAALMDEASRVLKVVRPIIESQGEVEFVGSYAWGTMYDRDIDISLWMDGNRLKEGQRNIVSSFLALDGVYEVKTRDLISYHLDSEGGRNLKCVLIMLKIFNTEGKLWNLDICLFDRSDGNNNAMPFDEEVLAKIESMADEKKQLIVDIKKAVTDSGLYLKGRSSVDIYLKVVAEGVGSVEEYMPYAYDLAGKKSAKAQIRESAKK